MKPSAKAIEMATRELRARLSQTNTATQFGFVLADAGHGRVKMSMRVDERHLQVHGVVHGGILAALAAVYIVLGILYESFIHPITILSTIPSAGIGALLALQLMKMDLSIIAIIGIILNLTVIVKERERELAVLRSLGGSSFQLLFLILLEAFFLTIVAVLLGIIGGCALAIILTNVINVTFFGWTIPVHFPWTDIAPTGVLLLGVGVLAGLFPALLAARASNLRVLRSMV